MIAREKKKIQRQIRQLMEQLEEAQRKEYMQKRGTLADMVHVKCPWCGEAVPADEPLHDCQ